MNLIKIGSWESQHLPNIQTYSEETTQDKTGIRRTAVQLSHFNEDWTKIWPFIVKADSLTKFRCVACMKNFSCSFMFTPDVRNHLNTIDHQLNLEAFKKRHGSNLFKLAKSSSTSSISEAEVEMKKDSSMTCTLIHLNNKAPTPTPVSMSAIRHPTADGSGNMSKLIMPPVKRVCLGGRGREWVPECLKLLKIMSSLSDAKVFLEPVDPIKYADYYVTINEPIDLSKIQLKFHGGSYNNLTDFAKDMRLMFDNYKKYFKDATNKIYGQVRYISSWFETEIEKVNSHWCRLWSVPGVQSSVRQSLPRTGSLEAKIQAMEADNQRILGGMQPYTTPAVTLPKLRPRVPQSVYTIRLIGNSKSVQNCPPRLPAGLVLRPTSNGSVVVPTSTPASNVLVRNTESANVIQAKVQPSTLGPILAAAKLVLLLEVSNVWFGATRCKPCRPMVISEQGIKLVIKDGETDVEFVIESDEIVRCAAYFGNARKHTLFVFVVPNCTRRLPASLGDRQSLSTLIVIFIPALSARQIADLVYLFWRMSRGNIFSSTGSLLTEVDQKGALSLLSNIKPTILSSIVERLSDRNNEVDVAGEVSDSSTQQSADSLHNDVGDNVEVEDTKVDVLSEVKRSTKRLSDFSPYSSDNDSDPFDDDPSDDYSPDLPIKFPPPRQTQTKRRRKVYERNQEDDHMVDNANLPQANEDEVLCKTEVVDEEYKDDTAEEEQLLDLSEQYTILQQWEPEAVTPRDEEDDEEEEDDGSLSNVEHALELVLTNDAGSDDEEDLDVDSTTTHFNTVQSNSETIDDLVMTHQEVTLRCPITQQLMRYPMKNKHCGHCYDKKGVENLIKHRGNKARCPVPGCCNEVPLNMKDLILQLIRIKTH